MSPGHISENTGNNSGNSWNHQRQQKQSHNAKPNQDSNKVINKEDVNKSNPKANNGQLEGRKPESLLLEKLPSFFDSDEDPRELLVKKLEQCLVVLDIPIGYSLNMSLFQGNSVSSIGGSPTSSGMFMGKKGGLMRMGSSSSFFDTLNDRIGSENRRKDYLIYTKISILQEIRDFLRSSPSGIYTKEVCMAIIEVVKTNIFRITVKNEMQCNTDDEFGGLVPISVSNDSGNTIDVMTTMIEYSWDILLRMVISPQFTDKIALELLTANFLTELIESMINMSSNGSSTGSGGSSGGGSIGGLSGLGGSGTGGNCNAGLGCPQNECEYAKTVLHRLYAKYMPMRNMLRVLISSALKEMSECQATSSTTFNPLALLDVLSSIVNGYTTPLKQEHINMLSNVLLPLHKNPNLSTYHSQLVSVIKVFVQKDPSLIVLVLNKVIEMYPKIDSSKELLFITEIGDFVDISNHQYIKPIFGKVIDVLCMASLEPNVQVAEKALTTLEKDSLFSFIRDSPNQYGATVLLYLQMNKSHWAPGIQNSTQRVIDKIIKAISGNNGYYSQQQGNSKISLDKMTLSLIQKKQTVVNDRITREYAKESENAKFWVSINEEAKKKLKKIEDMNKGTLENGENIKNLYKDVVEKFSDNPTNPLSVDWVERHNLLTKSGNSNGFIIGGGYSIVLKSDDNCAQENIGENNSSDVDNIGNKNVDNFNYGNNSNLIVNSERGNNSINQGMKHQSSQEYMNTMFDQEGKIKQGSPNSSIGNITSEQLSRSISKESLLMPNQSSGASTVAVPVTRTSPVQSPLRSSPSSPPSSIQSGNINGIVGIMENGNGGITNINVSQDRQNKRRRVRRGSSTSQYKIGRSVSGDRIITGERQLGGIGEQRISADPIVLTHSHHGTSSSRNQLHGGIPIRYTHSSNGTIPLSQLSIPPMEEYPGHGVMRVKKKKKTKRRLNYVNETGNILLAPMANGY